MKKPRGKRDAPAERTSGALELPSWWPYVPDAARQWANEAECRLALGEGIPPEQAVAVRLALRELTADRPAPGRGRPERAEVHFWLACYYWHAFNADGLKKQAALATLAIAQQRGVMTPSASKISEIAERLKQPAVDFLARISVEITERMAREELDASAAAYGEAIARFLENRLATVASRK